MRTTRTTTLAATAAAALLVLSACSGDQDADAADDGSESPSASNGAAVTSGAENVGDSDTWPGYVQAGAGDIQIGEQSSAPSAISVECSTDADGAIVATLSAPGGYNATSTQPAGGGPAPITVTGPDYSLTWDENGVPEGAAPDEEGDPNTAVQWGVTPTLTGGIYDLTTQDLFSSGATVDDVDAIPDYVVDLADSVISCEGQP